jgi:hypothetical protein
MLVTYTREKKEKDIGGREGTGRYLCLFWLERV